jgi:uncharacterized membrane protein (Fun14 family)
VFFHPLGLHSLSYSGQNAFKSDSNTTPNEGSKTSGIIPSLAYQLGIGGVGGFIIGYAIKKLSKLIIVLMGLFLLVLLYLGTSGAISIDFGKLWDALAGVLGLAGQATGWLIGVISVLPFVGSFAVGFLLGFKLG